MGDFGTGISGFGRAFGFAFRHRMGWMFLVPIGLWALFAVGVFAFGSWLVDQVGAWAAVHLGLDVPAADLDGWAGFWNDVKAAINGARDLLILIALKLALFYLLSLFGKYVVLIVLSPLLAYASERTEEVLTGVEHPFRLGRFLKDLLRGIGMALRNGFLELAINVAVWLGTLFLPLAAPVSMLVLWGVSAWFYGFSMFDYVFERRRLGIGASARTARSRSGLVMGNGILFSLLMKVPFVGPVFAPLLAAIGAVLAWHEAEGTPGRRPA